MPLAGAVADLVPQVVAFVESRKEQVLAQVPSGWKRSMARSAWPLVMALVPKVVEAAYAYYVLRIEHLEIGQLIDEIRRDAPAARQYLGKGE